jgi:hypothetical protein
LEVCGRLVAAQVDSVLGVRAVMELRHVQAVQCQVLKVVQVAEVHMTLLELQTQQALKPRSLVQVLEVMPEAQVVAVEVTELALVVVEPVVQAGHHDQLLTTLFTGRQITNMLGGTVVKVC